MTLISDIENKRILLLKKKKDDDVEFQRVLMELRYAFCHFSKEARIEHTQDRDCVILKASRNNFWLQVKCYHKSYLLLYSSIRMSKEIAYQLDRVGHLYDLVTTAFAELLTGEPDEQEIQKPESLPSRSG